MRRFVTFVSALAFLIAVSQPPSFANQGGGGGEGRDDFGRGAIFGVNPVEFFITYRKLQLVFTMIVVITLTNMMWLDLSRATEPRDTGRPKKKGWSSRSNSEAEEEKSVFDDIDLLPLGNVYQFGESFMVTPDPGAAERLRDSYNSTFDKGAPVTLTERIDEENQQSFDMPAGSLSYLMKGDLNFGVGYGRYKDFNENMEEAEDIGRLYYGYDVESPRLHFVIQRSF